MCLFNMIIAVKGQNRQHYVNRFKTDPALFILISFDIILEQFKPVLISFDIILGQFKPVSGSFVPA